MTAINITARNLSEGVQYRPFKKEKLNGGTTFLTENLVKEVIQGTEVKKKRNVKELKKLYKGFVSILAVGTGMGMLLPLTTFAQETTNPLVGQQDVAPIDITPPQVMEWGMTLALIVVSVGVALSVSMLAVAGIYRMFRKRKESAEWTTDIVKGLVQVLISIPIVYALFYLAQLIFQHLPMLGGLL